MSGKVVVTEFMTIDGVIQDPGGSGEYDRGGWSFEYDRGEEGDKFKLDELKAADAQLLGRITYEGFAKAWPTMEDDAGFADRMNGMPKYVVSTTIKDPEWENTKVISDNVPEEVAKLKDQYRGRHPDRRQRQADRHADRERPGRRVAADGLPHRPRPGQEALPGGDRSQEAEADRRQAARP